MTLCNTENLLIGGNLVFTANRMEAVGLNEAMLGSAHHRARPYCGIIRKEPRGDRV